MRRLAGALALVTATVLVIAAPVRAQDRDCPDFDNQAQAQEFYENSRPGDPHGLDGNDNDGRGCESLPCPCAGGGRGWGRRRTAAEVPDDPLEDHPCH